MNAKTISFGQFLLGLAVALCTAGATIWALGSKAGEMQADLAHVKDDVAHVKGDVKEIRDDIRMIKLARTGGAGTDNVAKAGK